MKFTVATAAVVAPSVLSFQQQILPRQCAHNTVMSLQRDDDAGQNSRRSFFQYGAASLAGIAVHLVLPEAAKASLLDDFGTDPTKIKDPSETEAERKKREAFEYKPKAESNFEPNLRSNYYYPTNKKRYLPRIKKCNDAIPDVATMIGTGDWEGAEFFVNNIADDTILPMKLYTSSLLGGGTNVKVSFAKDMTKASDDFEKAQKKLVKALQKRNQEKSSQALEELATAMTAYRTAGRLLGPDAGGDIPSVDEIRRSACRVQGRTFEQKIKARDERVKTATSSS
jgi:hypothetical protein